MDKPPAEPMRPGEAPARMPAGDRRSWHYRFRRDALQDDWDFIRRVLIVLGLIGLAYFLWSIGRVLLLIFAAVLVAVLLRALASLIGRYTPVPPRWRLWAAVATTILLVAGFVLLFGAQVTGQLEQVAQRLPQATNEIGVRFGIPDASARVEQAIKEGASGNVMTRVAGFGFTVLGGLADLLLVVVAGIYLAADPELYRRGAAKLFPPSLHGRIDEALTATGTALRLWFSAQLVAMTIVGTLAGLAYWIIGLPAPLALGIIAGITDFIPFLGPILGALPALIFAATQGPNAMIATLVAVIVIQQLEGNVITPLLQKRAVALPPAVALFAIVVFGLLFGFIGVFLAVPLAVALMVLIKKIWVRDALGEETSLPGERDHAARRPAAEPSRS